jgi:AmmeMemoRadiSam system protein A/AmmeMemoRadiSam system protein B
MPIIAAFMVPHPPIIIPEIGKGEEKKIKATREAYLEVGKRVAALKPDTIIISSPHAEAYSDYFQVSSGSKASGDFGRFGAENVRLDATYDQELIAKIDNLARAKRFPAGTAGEDFSPLDHGTMIPLYFINQFYTDYKLVRVGLSGFPLLEHYAFGELLQEAVASLPRRVVYIASGDLSHCQKTDGPYGFKPEGPAYDRHLMELLKRGAFDELLTFDPHILEKAEECGHRSFCIMAGALDGIGIKAEILSHEDTFGVGYGVAEFLPQSEDPSRHFGNLILAKEKEKCLAKRASSDAYVQLAFASLEAQIGSKKAFSLPAGLPASLSSEKAGVFVSIHKFGDLRGCIGTTSPTTSCVGEEIIRNALEAAEEDPRFPGIEASELPFLELSVDVLKPAEKISSPNELDPKKYGVIVSSGFKRGLLLPDLDGVDTPQEQIAIAKKKAGIGPNDVVELSRFEVVRHR